MEVVARLPRAGPTQYNARLRQGCPTSRNKRDIGVPAFNWLFFRDAFNWLGLTLTKTTYVEL